MSDLHNDIVAMARAASYDDRLADGMLYRKLADEIERFQAIERHRDHLHDCLQRAERERDEALALLREATSDECCACGASLHPNMTIPPHCEDCIVDDDAICDHEARVNTFRARLDAALGGEVRGE